MILGIDMGFWYGMAAVAVATLIGILVAWCLPPKKEEQKQPHTQPR